MPLKPPAGSIKSRLTAVLLVCLLCPALLFGWAIFHHEHDFIRESRIREVGGVADARLAMLRPWLRHAENEGVGLLQTLRAVCQHGDSGIHACATSRLERFAALHHAVGLTLQTGAEGDLTVGVVPEGGSPPFAPGQLAATVRAGTDGGAAILLVAEDAASGFRLLAAYPAEVLREIFAASADLGASGETFLADKDGFFITPPRYPLEHGAASHISAAPMQRCLGGENGEVLDLDYRDASIIHGFRFVPEIGGGCIMAHIDQAEAFSSLKQLTSLLVVETFLLFLSGGLAAAYLAKRLSQPILALTGMARSLAEGDFTRRVSVGGYAEVAELSRLFNIMAEQLDGTITRLKVSEQTLDAEVQERTAQLEHLLQDHRGALEETRVAEERLRMCQAYGGVGAWENDLVNDRQYWSESVTALLGFPEGATRNWEGFMATVHPADRHLIVAVNQAHIEHGKPYEVEYRIVNSAGDVRWMRSVGGLERNPEGKLVRMRGIVQEITARKQAEQELRIAAAAFETQEGITITDAHHVILRVNRAFTEITGYSAEEAIGKKPSILKSGHHDDAFYREMYAVLHRDGFWQGEIWDRHKDGHVYPKWLAITAVKDEAGQITHFVGNFTDITERKASEEKIRALAFYDTLTGLPNRRLLYERLAHAIATSQRSACYGALLYLDLDNFKTLNDTQGHPLGDELLLQTAQRLKDSVREVDTVARLGGDEFVVLLEDLDPDDEAAVGQAKNVAEKIVAALGEPFVLSCCEHHCSASIGITLFNDREAKPEAVLASADTAMYEAKRSGKNAYRFFDAACNARWKSGRRWNPPCARRWRTGSSNSSTSPRSTAKMPSPAWKPCSAGGTRRAASSPPTNSFPSPRRRE